MLRKFSTLHRRMGRPALGEFKGFPCCQVKNLQALGTDGVGAVEKTPVVIDDAIAIRSISYPCAELRPSADRRQDALGPMEWRESGDDEAVKLEIRLTADNDAEMRFVGVARIKPIRLRRAA